MEVIVNQNQAAADLLKQHLETWRVSIFADSLHIVLDDPDRELPRLLKVIESAQITISRVRPISFSLEDAFIGIVQRSQH